MDTIGLKQTKIAANQNFLLHHQKCKISSIAKHVAATKPENNSTK